MAHFSAKPVNTVFHQLIRFGRPASVAECWCSDRDSSITRPVLQGRAPPLNILISGGEPHTVLHQQRYIGDRARDPKPVAPGMGWKVATAKWHIL